MHATWESSKMGSDTDLEIIDRASIRQQIDGAISEIVHWFQDVWTAEGRLPPFELTNAGKPVGKMTLLTDLADYLPMLYLAGAHDYVKQQADTAIHAFQRKHVIYTPRARRGLFRFWLRSNPFYSSDFLFGLVLLLQLDNATVGAEQLQAIAHRIIRTYSRDGWLSKEVVYPFRWRLPITESDSLLFVEIFAEISNITGNEDFRSCARVLLKRWLNHHYTRTWGLVPQFAILSPIWQDIPRFAQREVTACLYKHNTALLAGLLALYHIEEDKEFYKDAIFRTADALSELLIRDDGRVYFQWVGGSIENRAYGISLGNANIIEPLIDIYQAFGRDQDLMVSQSVAGYWMKLQNSETGLVAESPTVPISHMDHQTDFAVNLHRLYSLTNDQMYHNAAIRLMQAQIVFHRTPHGYINVVLSDTGEAVDSRIETRYTSLFLKILILVKMGRNAWATPMIRKVMSDR